VLERHRRRLLGENVPRAHEFRLITSSGATRWVYANSVRIEWNGNPATLNFLSDTTQRKVLETQLLHAQKMEAVGQLAGGIAHDFNNMLSAIIGYGNMALMDLPADAQVRGDVEQMLAAASRAADLTRGLLTFSRKQVINPQPVVLDGIIDRVQGLLARIAGESVALLTQLRAPDGVVLADPGQIEQMLVNLVSNSRDAMPRGGTITIATAGAQIDDEFIRRHGYGTLGRYVLVSVVDTGEGMDEATLQRVFEPFFTTKEVGKGTGLGLATVYGAVKQHGGYVNVESEPGQGTAVRIYLPAAREAAKPVAATDPPGAAPGRGTETVLLAEDDPAVGGLTRRLLEESGYRVIVASDGQRAVERLAENLDRIDLLLLDAVMPRKNGKEVAAEARRMKPGIKILLTSGYTAETLQVKDAAGECLSFIPKPASPANLLRKIREVLDHAGDAARGSR
jgi:signal transduction histidine kinase/ActR/RegA family two-component response regulator